MIKHTNTQSSNDKAMPRIVRLKGDFQEELTSLDHTPLRTALCVYVYVMNKSQYSVREILSNKVGFSDSCK